MVGEVGHSTEETAPWIWGTSGAGGYIDNMVAFMIDRRAATPDGVHNRIGGGYTMVSGLPLKDAEVNQYSESPYGNHAYDKNGNLVQLSDACAGDINGDHVVDLADQNLVFGNMGVGNTAGDANGDGVTDLADFNLVQGNFGKACEYKDYRYDYMNRLTSYVGGSGLDSEEHEYRYDALGRRVISRKDIGEPYTVSTRFIYGGAMSWQLIEEYEEDFPTDLQSSHVYCGLAMDDVLMYSFDDGAGFEDYYIHADEQYTVMAVSDDAGNIQERYSYGDYGEPVIRDESGDALDPDNVTDRVASLIGNRHLYTGQIFDEETGLSQFRHRYLHHGLGRFVTRDPMEKMTGAERNGILQALPASGGMVRYDSSNLFAYVSAQPHTYIDPSGLAAQAILACAGAAIVRGGVTLAKCAVNCDGKCWCRARCAAAVGCAAGALLSSAPSFTTACIISAMGALAEALCLQLHCGIDMVNPCAMFDMALSTGMGCLLGWQNDNSFEDWIMGAVLGGFPTIFQGCWQHLSFMVGGDECPAPARQQIGAPVSSEPHRPYSCGDQYQELPSPVSPCA